MNKPLLYKNILLVLTILFSSVTFYSKFISSSKQAATPNDIDEKFDEHFLSINSTEKLDSLIFQEFRKNNYDTAKTVIFIDNFLRNRFYHSYSILTLKDNWIAVVLGNTVWSHFLFPVAPDNIIEHPAAACSQQGILFQQLLDHLKIPSSTIKFFPLSPQTPGHYAVSVYYGNSWHFYDPNREPIIVDSTMPSIEKIVSEKMYEKMYSKPSNLRFQGFFREKSFERVTKKPFSKGKMYYFQGVTAFLSGWLWLGFLLLYLLYSFRLSPSKEK